MIIRRFRLFHQDLILLIRNIDSRDCQDICRKKHLFFCNLHRNGKDCSRRKLIKKKKKQMQKLKTYISFVCL